jgi:hypothetical protein
MGPTGALAVGGLRVADCTGTRRSTTASSLLLGLRPETADARCARRGRSALTFRDGSASNKRCASATAEKANYAQ